ncbi:hypothetical protein WDJ51_15135 [Rathayibacter sp. YIM 133350]|uniref:hypothetical protein n=1 Tax=Rathayibacter sp. YIM 133350 TaxID=3131992 RepID=UPI00307E28A6
MSALRDIELILPNEPGALARFGRTVGDAGVSLEGGGVFTHGGVAIAHFLVDDADRAAHALDAAGLGPVGVNRVVMVELDQELPGQLGAFTGRLGEQGIDILVQYSDHDHSLVIITREDQHDAAERVARDWMTQRENR